ncbi:MAG: 2Fe-2S iron-sulfur cluster binding domain-containing protein [Alphaproteobacteria bacterium]|nr:2Fe-2S iron-sulfur cluster binding domain-containing protein [Alphaproteobacteria bacterium]
MAKHAVTFVFEDGRSVRLMADEADTIYLTALKSRVRIQTDCLEGACATCKARCTQGEYWLSEYSAEALSQEEAEQRFVLTCQMHAKTECVIEFPYDSALALKTAPETRAARVAAVERVAKDVVRLDVEPADPDKPIPFLPGQYVHLAVPGSGAKRSYSFANPPGETRRHAFYVKVLPAGAMSDYVGCAQVGDEMPMTGPFGKFYLRPVIRPIVMIAGGTGLAPMLSMLEAIRAAGGTEQPIRLLYGANVPEELFAADALAAHAGALPLTLDRIVVQGNAGWTGRTGYVTDLLAPDLINKGECDVYLCGPPPMIEVAERWLAAHGVAPHRIHAEKFLPN